MAGLSEEMSEVKLDIPVPSGTEKTEPEGNAGGKPQKKEKKKQPLTDEVVPLEELLLEEEKPVPKAHVSEAHKEKKSEAKTPSREIPKAAEPDEKPPVKSPGDNSGAEGRGSDKQPGSKPPENKHPERKPAGRRLRQDNPKGMRPLRQKGLSPAPGRLIRPEELSFKTDILRHEETEEEKENREEERKRRDERYGEKEYEEASSAGKLFSLLALLAIIGTSVVVSILHIELNELSLPVLAVTIAIVMIMGFCLGSEPSYVTLLIVAVIFIVGAVTGLVSEVLTGAVVFLGTVLLVKGRRE